MRLVLGDMRYVIRIVWFVSHNWYYCVWFMLSLVLYDWHYNTDVTWLGLFDGHYMIGNYIISIWLIYLKYILVLYLILNDYYMIIFIWLKLYIMFDIMLVIMVGIIAVGAWYDWQCMSVCQSRRRVTAGQDIIILAAARFFHWSKYEW